jgi:hypothetical protein
MFRVSILPPFSGSKSKPSNQREANSKRSGLLAVLFVMVASLAYSLMLKMEAVRYPEKLVNFY